MSGQKEKFALTPEEVAEFKAQKVTACGIGKRRDPPVSSSLVTYHLRKLKDTQIEEILQWNAHKAANEFALKRSKVERMLRDNVPMLDIINELDVSASTLTRLRRELGLTGKPKRVISPKKLVIERAQQVCDELKDYGWFSANSVYEKFGWSLREFCGVLKHINLHGVGEYSIERESGSNHPKWRFVEQIKLGSTSIRITKTDKSGFWLLATAPVPMRYISNLSA